LSEPSFWSRRPDGPPVGRPLFVAELEDAAHSVAVVAIAWTLARLEIGCVAVEVPIPTGDAIERKPGMAIEQAIMPNVPIIGENLRLDRIIADADELICIDVYVGVHRRIAGETRIPPSSERRHTRP
jgi:hypothetical protein